MTRLAGDVTTGARALREPRHNEAAQDMRTDIPERQQCKLSIILKAMKVRSRILRYMHLDKTYSLLTGKNTRIVLELFRLLDIHGEGVLNDVQFWAFMKTATDMTKNQIYKVFDMLDVDCSGTIDFDEFYLLICILIASNDNEEKHFIYRHSRTVFDLLDEDSSGNISAYEFETFGFLFNLHGDSIRTIFSEFDVSGDQELDYSEFKMFAMACIDRQSEIQKQKEDQGIISVFVDMCTIL